jgi:hypothetical protein
MFFNTPDFNLDEAAQGTWSILPTPPMTAALERDYNAMAGMIMGSIPTFAAVVDAVSSLEDRRTGGTGPGNCGCRIHASVRATAVAHSAQGHCVDSGRNPCDRGLILISNGPLPMGTDDWPLAGHAL